MSPRTLFTYLGALGLIALAFLFMQGMPSAPRLETSSTSTQVATVQIADIETPATATSVFPVDETPHPEVVARRIEAPYPFEPLSFSSVQASALPSLVNILCISRETGLHSTSGSGVVIDARGIILTNAHVAQYVLLAQSGRLALSCSIRNGSPARPVGNAEVLFIPPTWVRENAQHVASPYPLGTGEHDYALLRLSNSPPSIMPAIPVDTREAIGFPGDPVLTISYPSEYSASLSRQFDLFPLSTVTRVEELLTFNGGIDALSIADTPGARSGSSGGGVVNAWGHLIGIITSRDEAETEARALTLSYIDRDLRKLSGLGLEAFLNADVRTRSLDFWRSQGLGLVEILLSEL